MVGAPHDPSTMDLLWPIIKAPLLSLFSSQKAVMFIAKPSQDDLTLMGELISTGKVRPIIDKSYTLDETSDAVRHVEEGHARGKVIITLDGAHWDPQRSEVPMRR